MKYLILFYLLCFSQVTANPSLKLVQQEKGSFQSRIENLLGSFHKERLKATFRKTKVLPIKASGEEIDAFIECFLEFERFPFELAFQEINSSKSTLHFKLPAWVNLNFLLKKLKRHKLKNHMFSYQFLADKDTETLRLILDNGGYPAILHFSKNHSRKKVIIIVDDVGYSGKGFPLYLKMNHPVTFAILPFYPSSAHLAEVAWSHGFEVMLHMPMESKGPRYYNYESLIETGLEKEELVKRIKDNISRLPAYTISGFNNHEGSKATADENTMNTLMEEISTNYPELYFIDSITSNKTLGYSSAKKWKVKTQKRSFDFLDNIKRKSAIKGKVEELVARVLNSSQPLITILHEKRVSAVALEEMLPVFKSHDIEVISPSELLSEYPAIP